jgi:hypothetical protein
VGVVGVAIFRERVQPPVEVAVPRPAARAAEGRAKGNAPSASAAKKPTDRPGLGTEFGEQHESRVRQTTFIRESENPASTLDMRYNDRAGLRALGINVPTEPAPIEDDVALRESATPFPGDRRFAQPPP